MPNNHLIKPLVEFGLSQKEAAVYLALLELEMANAGEIAKAAGLNRSSTYVVLESLKKKGLAGISDDKSVRRYIASSPDSLFLSADEQAKHQKSIKEKIEAIVPELKALHKDTKPRPRVRIYEGRQGLISAFEDSLDNKEKVMRVCSSVENLMRSFPDYFGGYVERRIQKGIKMYGIHPRDKAAETLIKATPKFDAPVLIPKSKYPFPADLAIYDNRIGYMSYNQSGGLAIIIESKEIAEVMKGVFDLAWKEASRFNKKIK